MSGGSASEEFDGRAMALDAWGERADARNSCFPAFAYLYRRFGPPFMGSDDHKELCSYVIHTPMPGVFVDLGIKGGPLTYAVRYLATGPVREEFGAESRAWYERVDHWTQERGLDGIVDLYLGKGTKEQQEQVIADLGPRPHHAAKEWRTMPGPEGDMNRAIHATLCELMRPIYIRDVAIDLFGVTGADWKHAARPSKYAGFGVPVEAMNDLLKAV